MRNIICCNLLWPTHIYILFFLSLLTWIFLIYILIVIPFPSFQANIPLTSLTPSLWGFPPHPPPITALSPNITFTGASVLAGPRASPSTGALPRLLISTYEDGAQGQSLGSGLVPGSSGGLALLFIWSLKPLHAPSVLSLIPSMGVPFSVQWFNDGIHLCICSILAVFLRTDLHLVPVSQHFVASSILSSLVAVYVWATCVAFAFLSSFLSFIWANFHLSVSAYHVCFSVIGLPHSG